MHLGAFEALKPLKEVVISVDYWVDWTSSFNEAFFLFAAECGVRSITFDSVIGIDLGAALSFGFAEPAAGGDRSISGVNCELHDDAFFEQLIEVFFSKFTTPIGPAYVILFLLESK